MQPEPGERGGDRAVAAAVLSDAVDQQDRPTSGSSLGYLPIADRQRSPVGSAEHEDQS
jgi:hypothetical protein